MKYLRKYSKQPVIELTPMIDMLFLLLIFFMLNFHYGDFFMDVQLPKSENSSQGQQKQSVDISVTRNGEIYIDKKKVDLEQFKSILAPKDRDKNVYLRADKETQYQRVIDVMDTLKGLGFKKVSLSTSKN